jgi:hypothetical protein
LQPVPRFFFRHLGSPATGLDQDRGKRRGRDAT